MTDFLGIKLLEKYQKLKMREDRQMTDDQSRDADEREIRREGMSRENEMKEKKTFPRQRGAEEPSAERLR